MLLAMADAARSVADVSVVGPSAPTEVADRCRLLGLRYVDVGGADRRRYLMSLARWAASHRTTLAWCNGLAPSLAASPSSRRQVVHIHQHPRGLQRSALGLVVRRAERVVVPSQSMKCSVPSAVVLENWTAPRGVDRTVRRRNAEGRFMGSETFTVGFLGRLSPAKGIDVFAAAVNDLRRRGVDVAAVVAGDNRFSSRSEQEVARASIASMSPHARTLGWVDRNVLFAVVDVLVVPSTWSEPFGLVAAEAMGAGVPVAVSDAGALPEVVGDGYPWVFSRGDPGSLATCLAAMQADRDGVAAWTARMADRWAERYSPEAGAERFLEVLGDVLAGSSSSS